MEDFEISPWVERIKSSPIRAMFENAKNKKDFIDLSLGQPDICDPLVFKINKKLLENKTDLTSYGDIAGIPELRDILANFYNAKRENLIMTIGASGALFLACGTLLQKGDEVIIFEPYFVAYPNLASFFGAKAVFVKTDKNFFPDIKDLKNKISNKTKIIFINSPNNPTGAVYPKEVINEIIKCAKKVGAWIVSDEIYSSFEKDSVELWGEYEKTCVVSGFAKSHGIPGWRLGYLLAPAKLIFHALKLQQLSYVCAPRFAQEVMVRVLKQRKSLTTPLICKTFKERQKIIQKNLGDDFQVGAFYSFLKTKNDGAITSQKLLAKGIMTVPGIAFAKSKEYHSFIRIAHNADKNILLKALKIIQSQD